MTNVASHIDKLLSTFGLTSFRPGQHEVITSVLDGSDTLCIMPTGGGKSLCYQLPSIARDGLTIVVSPLIALMKDQVDSLQQLDITAALINSSISAEQQWQRIQGMQDGHYKLVYIAPERLRSSSFMKAVQNSNVKLLAVDEAHCISHWGHDFRPDYARLGRFRERIGNPQTIALTATATSLVRDDICQVLGLKDPQTFVSGFARENLALNVESVSSNSARDARLLNFLNETPGAGIIYASTRKNCEHLVEILSEQIDRQIEFYHAGLTPDRRRLVQDQFMSGEIPIVVATNAFGMGIDKADLRFVVHYNLPGSIEAYYQEAGRAGRDGEASECLMFYSYQDRFIQQFFIENRYPSRSVVKQVYEYLRSINYDPIELTLLEVKDELGLSIGTEAISTCENLLEKAGALERLDSKQNMAAIKIDSELNSLVDLLPREAKVQRQVLRALEKRVGSLRNERVYFLPKKLADELDMKWDAVSRAIRELSKLDAVDYVPPFRGRALHLLSPQKTFENLEIDFQELERRKQAEYQKLEQMIRLATTPRCRQLEILEYFGDPDRSICGRCDNCKTKPIRRSSAAADGDRNACLFAIQVALSGAARTHGRIGKTLIAQMLSGSTSKKIKNLGLHRLSTFGLLKPLRQSDAIELLDWLIDYGYLKQIETTKFRPVIKMTDSGKTLMSGKVAPGDLTRMKQSLVQSISMSLKGKSPKFADDSRSVSGADNQGIEIPTVVGNATESHGEAATLPIEVSTTATNVIVTRQRIDLPEKGVVKPTYYWTWKLLKDGYTFEQVQDVRNIDKSTLTEHVLLAAENHLDSDPSWLLTPDELKMLGKFVNENEQADKAKLISRLPKSLTTQQLLYYLNVNKSYVDA